MNANGCSTGKSLGRPRTAASTGRRAVRDSRTPPPRPGSASAPAGRAPPNPRCLSSCLSRRRPDRPARPRQARSCALHGADSRRSSAVGRSVGARRTRPPTSTISSVMASAGTAPNAVVLVLSAALGAALGAAAVCVLSASIAAPCAGASAITSTKPTTPPGSPRSPRRAARRQSQTCWRVTSKRRATVATTASGSRDAITTASLSPSLQRRRRSIRPTTSPRTEAPNLYGRR